MVVVRKVWVGPLVPFWGGGKVLGGRGGGKI